MGILWYNIFSQGMWNTAISINPSQYVLIETLLWKGSTFARNEKNDPMMVWRTAVTNTSGQFVGHKIILGILHSRKIHQGRRYCPFLYADMSTLAWLIAGYLATSPKIDRYKTHQNAMLFSLSSVLSSDQLMDWKHHKMQNLLLCTIQLPLASLDSAHFSGLSRR